MIKNIIFDIGQVIIHFEPILQPLATMDDLQDVAKYAKWVYQSPHWIELDREVWTIDEVVDTMVSEAQQENVTLDRNVVKELIVHNIDYCFYLRKPTVKAIEMLREKGLWKMYLLSNFNSGFYHTTKSRYPIFSTFDGEVISGEERLVKPDRAIYECLIDRYHLVPEECVFIDDNLKNVQGALACGMHAIHYTDSSKLLDLFAMLKAGRGPECGLGVEESSLEAVAEELPCDGFAADATVTETAVSSTTANASNTTPTAPTYQQHTSLEIHRAEAGEAHKIQNLVFDIGKVIKHFDPLLLLMDTFTDFDDMKRYYYGVFVSPLWDELDAGNLTHREIAHEMALATPSLDEEMVYHLVTTYALYGLYFVEPVKKLIEKLQSMGRWHFYLLSNFNSEMFQWMRTHHPFFDTFDGRIISGDVKTMKPDPKIYQMLLDKYDLSAESCFFVDDRKENVEAAIACGMQAIQYTDSTKIVDIINAIEN